MDYQKLIDYWIKQHNDKYSEYIFKEQESRYDLKNFF
jgi:hypothetical protein